MLLAKRSGGERRVALIGYAASLGAAAIGSVAYHGPQPRWAGKVHDASIVAVVAGALLLEATAQPYEFNQVRARLRLPLSLAALAGAAYAAGRSESPWCDPESLVQLHGLWHLLSAGCALAVALAVSRSDEMR
jgi:hypothetical protein